MPDEPDPGERADDFPGRVLRGIVHDNQLGARQMAADRSKRALDAVFRVVSDEDGGEARRHALSSGSRSRVRAGGDGDSRDHDHSSKHKAVDREKRHERDGGDHDTEEPPCGPENEAIPVVEAPVVA